MFSLEMACEPEQREMLIADLWQLGSAGIQELAPDRLRAFFEDDAARPRLASMFPEAAVRSEEQQDWVERARSDWEPIAVGSRFYLVPEWRDDPAPEDRIRIAVNPGMAFGTGMHETTQLCLEALERSVRTGMRVLDVGTGSGILAVAAGLLGAGEVWACDLDPVAVELAQMRIAPGRVFLGSADAVATGCFDLLVANISAEAVTGLAGDLLRCLEPQGLAIVSGFELTEAETVAAALRNQGGEIGTFHSKGQWAAFECSRRSTQISDPPAQS